jgi:eukaryotic-like serine/threonine-protein kinase
VSPGAAPDRLFLDFQAALAGRYSLERELGRGGMGIVYCARDLRLERVVAIKLLPPQLADAAERRQRFVREARMAAQLSHPHIIPIHAVEEVGALVFFVMSYIDGEALGTRLRRDGRLKPADTARMLREVAWALAYAHRQSVVHRDIKPDNILLEQGSGRALVADFGIARLLAAPREGDSGEGRLVGTPEYMSPEQALGEPVDGRSDLYSLGVVGYYALSGRLPFTAASVTALIGQHINQPPPPLDAHAAPPQLVAAIERCLAKDPAQRFQTGEELAAALAPVVEGHRELPVPIRAFLSESRAQARAQYIAPFIAAAVLVPMGLNLLLDSVFAGNPPTVFRGGLAVIAAVLVAAAAASPIALAVRSVRRLLNAGYRHEDLVHGLGLELARRREEQEFAAGVQGATWWERWMRTKMYASLGLVAVSGAMAFLLPYPAVLVAFGLFGLSCATAVATGFGALAASRSRLDDAEERRVRFWKGRMGRWLFSLARFGLRGRAGLPPVADRPTEVALGVAALDLFAGLPGDVRRALGDLPAVVRALEEQVQRLRNNGHAGELREALGALETIRYDLLRLHGGAASLDGLTADLGAARQIGEQVDALLEGVDETRL